MTCCCFGSEGRSHVSGAALVIFVVVRMALEHRPCQPAPTPGEFFLPLSVLFEIAQGCLKNSTCPRRNLREVERVLNPVRTLLITTLAFGSCWNALADPIDFSAIDAKIEKHLEITLLPGAGLLVLHENEVIHESFFGNYDKTTVVPIASATKWLSAAAVMTLVDDGEIKLNEPIANHISSFGFGEKKEITLQHLLSHTSGISSSHNLPGGFFVTPRQSAQLIARKDLVATPGEQFAYGGQSMQVAAGLAELKTGKSWREFFADSITKPLRMNDTSFGPEDGFNNNPMAAGGAFSTLRDYGKFMAMLGRNGKAENGKQVLSEEAVAAILSQQSGDTEPQGVFDKLMAAQRKGHDLYGLGCWIDRVDANGNVVGASSPGAFAFTPWIDLEHDVAGVFMVVTKPKSFLPTIKLVGEIGEEINVAVAKKN